MILPVLSGKSAAADLTDSLDLEALVQQLPGEVRDSMDGISPISLPDRPPSGLWESLQSALRREAGSAAHTAGVLLTVCVLVSLSRAFDLGGGAPQYILFAGVAAVSASALSDFDSYLRSGLDSIDSLAEYGKVLLPVLASAAAASGAVSGAAARYASTSFFISVLLELSRNVIVPCICAHAALSVADAVVGNSALRTAKKLVKKAASILLSVLCVVFTAWLTLSGVVSDSADALAARAAKTAISASLPVVGNILSDAASTLAAAAGGLKNSIGIFGLLAVAGICLSPFAKLSVRFLAYRLSAALCECVSDKRFSTLAEDLGTCFGMILALNGTAALMLFMSVYSLIRTVI